MSQNNEEGTMPPWEEELSPLEDKLRDTRQEVENNLTAVQKVKNVAKDFDSLGMVSVEYEYVNYGHGKEQVDKVQFVGYLSNLRGDHAKLFERAMQLNRDDASIEWDEESETYRVSVRLNL